MGTAEGLAAALDRVLGSKYELIERVGAGSMGVVFRARDRFIGRDVAIKALNLELAGDDPDLYRQLMGRFEREARAAGGLTHPNIVTIYDAGQAERQCYLVMEFLEGRTLKTIIKKTYDLPLDGVISYVRQIALALDYAHGRGIVHRDIKPDNIIVLSGDHIKITDFGIAKVLSDAVGDITRGDRILGTPNYMAPEQVKGEAVDGRTDLFSLGCVFYELLLRRRPFHGSSVGAILFNIISKEPRWLAQIDPELPPEYDRILRRLLAKEPSDRYGAARDLVEELDALPPETHSPAVSERFIRLRMGDSTKRKLPAPVSRDRTLVQPNVSPEESSPDLSEEGPQEGDRSFSTTGGFGRTPPPQGGPRRAFSETDANIIREAFQRGVRLYGEKRYAEAAKEFERALELNPDHDVAGQFLLMAHRKLDSSRSSPPPPGRVIVDGVAPPPRVAPPPPPPPSPPHPEARAGARAAASTSERLGRRTRILTAALLALLLLGIYWAVARSPGPARPGTPTPASKATPTSVAPTAPQGGEPKDRHMPEEAVRLLEEAEECLDRCDAPCAALRLDAAALLVPDHPRLRALQERAEVVQRLGTACSSERSGP